MKKVLIIAAALFISASAFAGEAWNNHLGFGWRLPSPTTMHTEKADWENLNMWQSGIDFQYTGVLMSNGFSVHAMVDYAISNSNYDTKPGAELSSLWGLNGDLLVGAGWAPIRTKELFFGFYGMIGYDFTIVCYDSEAFDSDKTIYKDYVTYGAFLPAANATFVWTPKKTFSLYATASVGYNCPTVIYREQEVGTAGKIKTKTISRGGVKVIPAVGISWKF